MILSPQERSKYFKGLLILMTKDRRIDEEERNILIKVGKLMGFEKKFCENAINDSLENQYLNEDVPTFSRKEFAISFVLDGLKLAISDRDLNPDELQYLKLIIKENDIEEEWFSQQVKDLVINVDDNYYDSGLHVKNYL